MAQRSPTSQGPRRRGCGCLGAIAAIAVLIIVAVASGGSKSKSLPSGAWGKTIACLEGHPLFLVTDPNSNTSAAAPDKRTTEVVINSQLHGYQLATIERTSSPSAARAVKRSNGLLAPIANYNIHGSIVWVWTEGGDTPHILASADDQDNISTCITGG